MPWKRLGLPTIRETVKTLRRRAAAAVLAEAGRLREARDMIANSLTADDRRIGADDWYVFGRIYEQYGEVEAAETAYERVERPSGNDPLSPYELAQHRLRALER